MTLANWTGIAGGLALFLYGIRLMGQGIERLAGAKLKNILEKLTKNRFIGLLLGVFITAIIQSSNATSAMAVGFVNAGLMEFTRASGVIFGANIGTTATGLLIALNMSRIASVIAFIGVIGIIFFKSKRINNIGTLVAGLGILFIGMNLMKDNMTPLANEKYFTDMLLSFENKIFLAVLVGIVFTAIVQSVSASVGILQAMALAGAVTDLDQVVFLILGFNIGACIGAVTAGINGTKDGKRTALIHVLFNVLAGLIWGVGWKLLPVEKWMNALAPDALHQQIAYMNLIEKVVGTVILFPFLPLLEKLARIIIPGEDKPGKNMLIHINSHDLGTTSIAIAQAEAEVARMFGLAKTNLDLSCRLLTEKHPDRSDLDVINANEETIDYLNHAITDALIKISGAGVLGPNEAKLIDSMHHVICDYERIGDHADNIAGYVHHIMDQGLGFSQSARDEITKLTAKVTSFVDEAQKFFRHESELTFEQLEAIEDSVDNDVDFMQEQHIRRMETGECKAEIGMLYVEILTDLERVADHALNIAEQA
ncbi:MAG: Na/Pi cotransporter family protein [Clostridia bacterium]|nr:Na/Pi cotransporter family protein [Clostridia bacterium]